MRLAASDADAARRGQHEDTIKMRDNGSRIPDRCADKTDTVDSKACMGLWRVSGRGCHAGSDGSDGIVIMASGLEGRCGGMRMQTWQYEAGRSEHGVGPDDDD